MCVHLAPDANPLTADELDVRIVTDDCVAVCVSTTPTTTGDSSAFTRCHIPAGANTTLLFSNRTLLMELLCPAVMGQLGLEGDAETFFEYSEGAVTLVGPTDISHLIDHALVDRITLEAMRFATGDDWLEATASLSMRGFGYRASASLAGRVDISVADDGAIVLEYSAEVAEVDLFVEPWVWLLVALGIALLPTLGAIVAIVLPILPWILNPVLDAIAAHLHVEGTEEFPPFPIRIDALILDDLMCIGRAVTPRRESAPRPDLWIVGDMEATDTGVTGFSERQIIGPVTETAIIFSSAHDGQYVARTSRMMFPIEYAWSLEGHVLAESGSTSIDGVSVTYEVDGPHCRLVLDSGESLSGLLEVTARAADGLELTDSEYIEVEGSTEIRSFHNVDVIAGPPMTELLTLVAARDESPYDIPAVSYEAGQPYATAAGRNPVAELRQALMKGTGVDLPIEAFD
jgi:hypothetical protein